MKLSKKTARAVRPGWDRMADPAIQRRLTVEAGALVAALVGAYVIQMTEGAGPDDLQRARLESTALLGEIDAEAMRVARWCVAGIEPASLTETQRRALAGAVVDGGRVHPGKGPTNWRALRSAMAALGGTYVVGRPGYFVFAEGVDVATLVRMALG